MTRRRPDCIRCITMNTVASGTIKACVVHLYEEINLMNDNGTVSMIWKGMSLRFMVVVTSTV